ncbi:MAG: helix-turn-helix transcriptional regulator [Actinomycetota bacterium]|nr:helix-turn-helix transcriptional regulator [Actinomycetota bacterium]
MSEEANYRIGARTAELRKIYGMTQRALALRANVYYSLLRKVEPGQRPASPSFTAAVARALSVHVEELTEQPYHSGDTLMASEQAGVSALRGVGRGRRPGAGHRHPRPGPACAGPSLRSRTTIGAPGPPRRCAPCLMCCVTCTGPSTRCRSARPVVYELLAAAYSYALVALYRLGHLDLAHLADERARTAAMHGDDPLRAAVAEWNHSLILMLDGSCAAGLRSIDRAGTLLDGAPRDAASTAVRGALHLWAAILAAHATDTDLAEAHLIEAQALTASGQDRANHYGTKFSAANVAIHRVAVPVELLDGTTAVHRASSVRLPADTAPSRVGAYWIDLARGWLLHGDRSNALEALQTARQIAPQLTRHHPQVHDSVRSLAARDRRTIPHLVTAGNCTTPCLTPPCDGRCRYRP